MSGQNRQLATPKLNDLLEMTRREIFLSLNCHAIGTITKFNPAKQTAEVQISYTQQYSTPDPNALPIEKAYPPLADVPVIVVHGGTAGLTMPIKPGDGCIVLFNDRDIDRWFVNGPGGPPESARLHSIADGIALVGLNPTNDPISPYDTARAVLYNGTTMVGVGESLIKIANASHTLNALLQELVAEVKALATKAQMITMTGVIPGGGVSGPPQNAADFVTIASDIDATASKIAELLE
jgi:hypothetical protein